SFPAPFFQAPGPTRPAPVSIIGAEDEDFENELETHPEERSSEFQSLEQVKRRPAHVMALLHHVALQFDSGPLLCCLHADMLASLGPKEAKKGFLDFYHNFLEKTAVLRVPVPPSVSFELDRTRPELLPEETQRRFLQEVVRAQQNTISRQLEDFRSKRLMGMTPGEPDLSQLEAWAARDRVSFEGRERLVAERLLNRLEDMHPTSSTDEEKSVAIVNAISAYMRYLGVRTKSGDKKARGNFFRKKMNRRTDDPPKPKKGLSIILDAARWNRGEAPGGPDACPSPPPGEKPGLPERKISQVTPPRGIVGPPGPDAPGVAVHPPPGESPDKEPGEKGFLPPESCSWAQGEGCRGDVLLSGRLGRSESLRVTDRRRPSRGSLGAKGRAGGRSRSDVDTDPGSATAALGSARRATPEPGEEGEPGRSGLELEPEEPPGWRELVPPDTLSGMHKNQVKRQEVISELLVTEAAHVRMLRVLHDLFYQPMADGGFFTMDELQNIFPSLDELIDVHSLFLESLMKLRQESGYIIEEIGDVLLARFDGTEGHWFQKISSRFCSRQSFALEQLKAKQRKEPRFCTFVQEAESRPRCRRLQLKDMIPTEMQRLTKYPLLLQSIWQNTEEPKEKAKVEQAAECCKEILHHVNQSVRDMEDLLVRMQEGEKERQRHRQAERWKQTKSKVEKGGGGVCVCDGDILGRRDKAPGGHWERGWRLWDPGGSWGCPGRSGRHPGADRGSPPCTDHRAFYVIFTWDQEAHIYELVAQTVSERKHWCTLITDTAGSLKVPAPSGRSKSRPSPIRGGGWAGAAGAARILSDLLPFSCPDTEGQLAASALREVLSLKQILLPAEEENGPGPAPESEGAPGAAQTQEVRDRLLTLEDTIKRLELPFTDGTCQYSAPTRGGLPSPVLPSPVPYLLRIVFIF
uniref:Rho guanine nucleotide exchange factor 1 n=1 Tax=Vombatus ursinus TaxID=29139 RepID=A0A4X2KSC5_VOMUR